MGESLKVFFCYAHEDEPLLNKLRVQLKPLERSNFINMWHDRDIRAGTEWEREIDQQLSMAQIILRHVYWQGTPLSKLQALPTDAKPVQSSQWHSLDEALFDVAEGIRKVVEELIAKTPANLASLSDIEPLPPFPAKQNTPSQIEK